MRGPLIYEPSNIIMLYIASLFPCQSGKEACVNLDYSEDVQGGRAMHNENPTWPGQKRHSERMVQIYWHKIGKKENYR